jgi:hypothetical protein
MPAVRACPLLTEALVDEGRLILGARGLLTAHPYHRIIGDAPLFATFDGTTHVVLEQIQWRLAQIASAQQITTQSALETMAGIYSQPPQRLVEVTRQRNGPLLLSPVAYLEELDTLPARCSLQPLAALTRVLFDLVRQARTAGIWDSDQGLRLETGRLFAYVETLIAALELADPVRRQALGMPALPAEAEHLTWLLDFTYGWFGGRLAATLRTLALRTDRVEVAALDPVERAFAQIYTQSRNALRLSSITGANI